jgi:hypothetical protein
MKRESCKGMHTWEHPLAFHKRFSSSNGRSHGRPVPTGGTQVEFPNRRLQGRVTIEQTLGEGCSGASDSKELRGALNLSPAFDCWHEFASHMALPCSESPISCPVSARSGPEAGVRDSPPASGRTVKPGEGRVRTSPAEWGGPENMLPLAPAPPPAR